MISDSGKHYLYRHIRMDKYQPFYIGVGTKSNLKNPYMRSKSKVHRNPHWKNVVNLCDYEVEIILESENYNFILNKEKEFILLHGRKDLNTGPLVNMTDGGEGTIGAIRTKQWQDKIVASNKKAIKKTRKSLSNETKEKIRKGNLGLKRKPETIEKVKLARSKQDLSHLGKPVIQMDLKGEVIKEWASIADARKVLKTGYNIRRAIINNSTCKGFKWEYKIYK